MREGSATMNRRITALTITAAAVFALAGCSGGGGAPANQTVEEACAVVNESVESAVAGFSDISADDPAQAAEAMHTAANAIADAAKKVSNPEVGDLLPSMTTTFNELGDAITAMGEGDLEALSGIQDLTQQVQEDVTAFQELCL